MKLAELQDIMRRQAQEDKKQKYVNVSAPTLPEALQKASTELGVGLARIAYELIQKGNPGTLGIGKKEWVVMAYTIVDLSKAGIEEESDLGFSFDDKKDRDGRVNVRKTSDGVYMQVIAPIGSGQRITDQQAITAIEHKTHEKINIQMVSKAVKRSDEEWVKVADIDYNPSEDAQIDLEVTDMEMKAYLTLHRPGVNGADPSAARIRSYLELNHVVEGIIDDTLEKLEANPVYNENILIAEGSRPKNGEDGKIIFSFDTDKRIRLREMEGGRVDFKELNTINNVVEGQVLAKLVPPERGQAGVTVTGKVLPAKDGKEKQLIVGNNVRLSDDRKQAMATTNGQVILSGEKISVEPIYSVDGNVSLKSGGNIVFLGSVEVKGNVEDGFSIKAAGNIEVHGTIEKCEIDCEGDIIVHNGITGKSGALIKAGGNIWAKFIENAHVEAGGIVVVNEGIINSTISCDHKIICRGKRASIVGGSIRASEEIDAKNLGSVAGVETVCEVGFDPKMKLELDTAQDKLKNQQKEQADIELNMGTLEKLIKAKKDAPQDKKDHYENLKARALELVTQIREVQDEIERLQRQMNELKNNGKISASGKVYPGVKVQIKDAYLEVRSEYRAVSFLAEQGIVKMTRYEESEQDISIVRPVSKQ